MHWRCRGNNKADKTRINPNPNQLLMLRIMKADNVVVRINPDRIRLILGDHDRRRDEAHQQQRLIERVFFFSPFSLFVFFVFCAVCQFVLLKNNVGVVVLIKVFIHPNFVKKTFNNDIALVKMRSEVNFIWCHFIIPCWYINLVFLFFYCLFDISSWLWIRSVSWAKLSYFFVMCKTNPK